MNKHHSKEMPMPKHSGDEAAKMTKAMGSGMSKGESHCGPDRSCGMPKTGKRGPFYHKQEGM